MDYTNIRRKYFQDNTFSISRLGVPIFLLLTGYLTLSKEINSDEDKYIKSIIESLKEEE